jgi:RNA polymerase sigma-70 factor (ECF subfamily)
VIGACRAAESSRTLTTEPLQGLPPSPAFGNAHTLASVPEPDFTLVRAAASGDQSALTELIQQTRTQVWRLCRYLVDAQSADDLTQETYLRVHRALPRFRGDASALTWILTITRRVCAAEVARRQRGREIALLTATHHSHATAADPSGKVDIDLLIADLEPERRLAFVLTQIVGCDYAEAARICDCPIGTIRSRVYRARTELAAQLSHRRLNADAR